MPKQILLVDDSVTIHRVVEITFAHEDYAVTAVKSADEGIERARQLKPDAVLADAGMAGKTGYDVCAALRQDPSLGKTACLILTGNFTPYDEGKGGQVGADGFVVKPFETQALIDKVKDAIARRTGGEVAAAVAAPAPAAATPAPVAAAPRPMGIESLGKPLSTIAAETAMKIPAQHAPAPAAAPVRPAPLPTPAASIPAAVAAAAPPGPRPQPKATLMGIPAVNPAALGVPPAAAMPAAPNVLRPPAAAAAPMHLEPPKPIAPAPAAPAPAPMRVEAPRPVAAAPAPASAAAAPARPSALPASVPQMPRPSLVPGVAAPKPGEARGFEPASHAVAPEATAHGRPEPVGGIGAVVREAAERAAQAVPAAISARAGDSFKGADYEAIARLSREVIEQVVWEVVPELAETIIRAELDRLVRERQNA